jgi:hypothetical protein
MMIEIAPMYLLVLVQGAFAAGLVLAYFLLKGMSKL